MKINAVFEGGGVKGIALVGAIRAAEQHGVGFHNLAGTSSGAIVASLLAAGYTADEMQRIVMETPLRTLARPTDWMRIKYVGAPIRLMLTKGLYSGNPLELWIRDLLYAKGVYTFSDLPDNKLKIIASDITDGRLLVLPDDLAKYGINPSSFPISKAIRMSASLPYFFEPVVLKFLKASRVYIVDGGLLSNFPLWIFDQRQNEQPSGKMVPTVGFQLVGRTTSIAHRIKGPFSMFYALFATMMEAHDERYIEDENRYRTIKIPTLGIRTTQFELSNEESMKLHESGYLAGYRFFDRWSLSAYQKNYELYQQKAKA